MSTEERLPGGFIAALVRLARLIRALHGACAGRCAGHRSGARGVAPGGDMAGERDT
jgi:hypothetical protein